MTKITYLLGAGASYNSCPIWNAQAKAMKNLATQELLKLTQYKQWKSPVKLLFNEKEKEILLEKNILPKDKDKILWYIGYFGKKGEEFNTVDTYARKLFLQGTNGRRELQLLKMAVSIFFDLWENFNTEKNFYPTLNTNSDSIEKIWDKIDSRYIALFSIFLEKNVDNLLLNEDITFITWNYDLQLESTFNLFASNNNQPSFPSINESFRYLENKATNERQNVFHLNGHRGFASSKSGKMFPLRNEDETIEEFWNIHDQLYSNILSNQTSFNNYIKYAWEHDLDSAWFEKIRQVLRMTDILVIIGYSFPLFNRKIDQHLFSYLHPNKTKEIIYQDPNSNEEIILNLFEKPQNFSRHIKLQKKVDQFYIPHNHFIDQTSSSRSVKLSVN
tara:strand:+ start:551 stop:1714 length:1164 start_codon:yes stop_codon:yes gene_type:complete